MEQDQAARARGKGKQGREQSGGKRRRLRDDDEKAENKEEDEEKWLSLGGVALG